jgi:hypothetical protein
MKNPCLECAHHLSGGDKNAACCAECADRVKYVAGIGGKFCSAPIEMTDMGRRRPDANKKKEERMNTMPETTTRTCNKCGETKPLDEFRKNNTCTHGREPVCKACRRIYASEKYANQRKITSDLDADADNIRRDLPKYAPAEPDTDLQVQPLPGAAVDPLTVQVGGDHYKHFAIQPIEFSTRNRLGFIEGCIIKRICRYNRPGGKGLQDLLKIKHEIDCLITIDEKEKAEGRQA